MVSRDSTDEEDGPMAYWSKETIRQEKRSFGRGALRSTKRRGRHDVIGVHASERRVSVWSCALSGKHNEVW